MERTARAGSGSPRTAVEGLGRSSAPPGGHAPLCLAGSGSLERPLILWPDSGDPNRLPHADGQKASDRSLISRDPLWLSREIRKDGKPVTEGRNRLRQCCHRPARRWSSAPKVFFQSILSHCTGRTFQFPRIPCRVGAAGAPSRGHKILRTGGTVPTQGRTRRHLTLTANPVPFGKQ